MGPSEVVVPENIVVSTTRLKKTNRELYGKLEYLSQNRLLSFKWMKNFVTNREKLRHFSINFRPTDLQTYVYESIYKIFILDCEILYHPLSQNIVLDKLAKRLKTQKHRSRIYCIYISSTCKVGIVI
jgi:hypothetical protein